jgi:hypothetical protein
MDDFEPITVDTHQLGRMRVVTSAREVAEMLAHNWHWERGHAYRLAVQACMDQMEGKADPATVRGRFAAAAKKAGIFARGGRP